MATHAYLSASRQGILAVVLLAVGMVEPVVDGWRRLVLVIVELRRAEAIHARLIAAWVEDAPPHVLPVFRRGRVCARR